MAENLASPEKPIVLLDGFYSGADRVDEALQHDCVTIAAGGVAITPFLSMLPLLLSRLGARDQEEEVPSLKRVAVHWSCREQELIRFVNQNYLASILSMARNVASSSLPDFQFVLHIHHTGKSEKLDQVEETQKLSDIVDPTEKEEDPSSLLSMTKQAQ